MRRLRRKAIFKAFKATDPYRFVNSPWVDDKGTRRGNALRIFKRAAQRRAA